MSEKGSFSRFDASISSALASANNWLTGMALF
jgi:hypothetical protein